MSQKPSIHLDLDLEGPEPGGIGDIMAQLLNRGTFQDRYNLRHPSASITSRRPVFPVVSPVRPKMSPITCSRTPYLIGQTGTARISIAFATISKAASMRPRSMLTISKAASFVFSLIVTLAPGTRSCAISNSTSRRPAAPCRPLRSQGDRTSRRQREQHDQKDAPATQARPN